MMLCSVNHGEQTAAESLAVKYLRNDMLQDAVARKDFQRELRLIGKLKNRYWLCWRAGCWGALPVGS